ncbi:MAG: DUF115 domain-containing protein, partial [Helicobacter sp.]|nr:DUF115 domain-containing protein [Helicobacter sp.]
MSISLNPRFEKNLQALYEKNPLLAAQLKILEPNQKYDVYVGKDPLNINIYDKENKVAIFHQEPLVETKEKIQEFESCKLYPFFYFFGMGNGIFFKLLLQQNDLKKLFIFEPELEIIYIALNFADFEEEILNERLMIFWSRTSNFGDLDQYLVKDGQWIYSKIYNLHIFNNYYGRYSQECLHINSIITRSFEHHVISVGNDSTDALIGLNHHISNLPELITTPSFKELLRNVKNTDTAVIVSTGPSLYKQLPLLKEYAPYLTIISVDASYPILIKHGIKPDIVTTLERVEPTADFYIKTPKSSQKDIIFAITSIVHKATTEAITTGIKSYSMRPFGYTRFFDLQEYGYAGIGMSAANMAYEIIVLAQFRRCIFIGQDLSFSTDGKTHSKDSIFGEKEDQYKQNIDSEKLLIQAYGGEGYVETTPVWKMFLNFFEKDIAETPYDIEVINATEGGARINGSKEIAFIDVLKTLPKVKKKDIKLNPPSKEQIQSNQKLIKNKIKEFLDYGYKKKKIVEKLFLKVMKTTEELEKLNKANQLEKINFKKLDRLLE